MTFFPDYAFFRHCRKFSTLSEKSIVGKRHMTFFPTMLFSTQARRAKSLQCSDLARLSSVEKSIVEKKKSYDFLRLCFFPTVSRTSDTVEKKHSREKSHMTFLQSYDFSTMSEESHLNFFFKKLHDLK